MWSGDAPELLENFEGLVILFEITLIPTSQRKQTSMSSTMALTPPRNGSSIVVKRLSENRALDFTSGFTITQRV